MGKFIETDRRINVTRTGGRAGWELLFYGYRVFVWEDEKVLEMDNSDGCKH